MIYSNIIGQNKTWKCQEYVDLKIHGTLLYNWRDIN